MNNSSKKVYIPIIQHYQSCLNAHGDTYKGMDWPNDADAIKRYNVMLDVIHDRNEPVSLLDFGCGTGLLYAYMTDQHKTQIQYEGLDLNDAAIQIAQQKFVGIPFYAHDVMELNKLPRKYDYVIMNGIFTEKRELDFDQMWQYMQALLTLVYHYTEKGIAFNVMSKAVDWERWDLFHLPTDLLIDFVTKKLSRNFIIRNDYGLYEYTVYIYR